MTGLCRSGSGDLTRFGKPEKRLGGRRVKASNQSCSATVIPSVPGLQAQAPWQTMILRTFSFRSTREASSRSHAAERTAMTPSSFRALILSTCAVSSSAPASPGAE